jgi:PAS domain-containing protein
MEDFLMARKLTYEQLEQRVKELEREVNVLKQAEANIRDSARRYRTLLDFVPYPMVVYTIDGRVSYLDGLQ